MFGMNELKRGQFAVRNENRRRRVTILLSSFHILPDYSLYYLWNIATSVWEIRGERVRRIGREINREELYTYTFHNESGMEIVRGRELVGKGVESKPASVCLLSTCSSVCSFILYSVHPDSFSHCLSDLALWREHRRLAPGKGLWPIITWSLEPLRFF